MNKATTKQLILISNWMDEFPCDKFFSKSDDMHCIHEAISVKEMHELITKGIKNE